MITKHFKIGRRGGQDCKIGMKKANNQLMYLNLSSIKMIGLAKLFSSYSDENNWFIRVKTLFLQVNQNQYETHLYMAASRMAEFHVE